MICDGETYDKETYPALAEHLLSLTNNEAYIVSDDETKFKVPDLRGEFLRGTGTSNYNIGSGASVGVHQAPTTIVPPYKSASANNGGFFTNAGRTTFKQLYDNADKTWSDRKAYVEVGGSGNTQSGAASISIRPTNTSVLYCIKT